MSDEFVVTGNVIKDFNSLRAVIQTKLAGGGGIINIASADPVNLFPFRDAKGNQFLPENVQPELIGNAASFYGDSIEIEAIEATSLDSVVYPEGYDYPTELNDSRYGNPILIFQGEKDSKTGEPTTILNYYGPTNFPENLPRDVLNAINEHYPDIWPGTRLDEDNKPRPIEERLNLLVRGVIAAVGSQAPEVVEFLLSDDADTIIERWFAAYRSYHQKRPFHIKTAPEAKGICRPILFRDIIFEGRLPDFYRSGYRMDKNQFDQASFLFCGTKGAPMGSEDDVPIAEVMFHNCRFDNAVGDGLQVNGNSKTSVISCKSKGCRRGGITVTSTNNDVFVDDFTVDNDGSSPDRQARSLLNIEIEPPEKSMPDVNDGKPYLHRNRIVLKDSQFETAIAIMNDAPNFANSVQTQVDESNANLIMDNIRTSRGLYFAGKNSVSLFKDCTLFNRGVFDDGASFIIRNYGNALFRN